MTIALVHVTFADAEDAERVASQLVDERLAAGVTLVPCASIFRSADAVETAHEISATFKTLPARAAALARRIAELHGDDLPVIESWPVAAPDAVVQWVTEATSLD